MIAAFFAAVSFLAPVVQAAAPVDDSARVLAGLLPAQASSPLASVTRNAGWQGQRARAEKSWRAYVDDDMTKIRAWSAKELADIPPRTVFYPFSGPDMLNAVNFLPQGTDFVLLGLEPVGLPPDFKAGDTATVMNSMNTVMGALDEILGVNFFLTNGMRDELAKNPYAGIAGIMAWFLVRTDHELLSARAVSLAPTGEVVDGKDGVEFVFVKRGSTERHRAWYFPGDISDAGLAARPGLVKFLVARGEMVTYLKAASYLMFRASFDDIRSIILSRSAAVITDDAGVPWHYFPEGGWETRLYGQYHDPIKLFARRCQPDLKKVYAGGASRGEVNFDFGYTYFRPHLVYARRPAGQPITQPVLDGSMTVGDDTYCEGGKLVVNRTPATSATKP
ncbi:MAG: hypothetical protein RLZZ299_277 [Pseudomonadota bacterium]